MHRTVQEFRGKIYLIGILLFLFVVNAVAQFEEGALVKGNKDAVYLISNGKACWIPSESILKALGHEIKMVIQIPDKEMIQTQKSQLLLRGSSDKIYRIENNKRRQITNAILFTRLGYDWNSVLTVNDAQLKNISEGEPIK